MAPDWHPLTCGSCRGFLPTERRCVDLPPLWHCERWLQVGICQDPARPENVVDEERPACPSHVLRH